MTTELARIYVPFSEVRKGTIKGADGKDIDIRLVKGLMTDESLDLDGQRVDADWAKGAAQKWFSRWGNIREQHSANAIGKSVAMDVLDSQKAIDMTGKVVDPLAILKVDEEILSGWSVGIKGARVIKDATAPNGRIVGGEIVEVSLVDHPANENCKVALVKSAKTGKLVDAEQTVVEKIAGTDQGKLAIVETPKAAGDADPDVDTDHAHEHTHDQGTDQEYSHSHQHDHADGVHAEGKKGDHQHDHIGKAIAADTTKAAALDGDNAIHNASLQEAIEAVRSLLIQEAGEPALDFQDVTWIARIGWDLTCWAAEEAWEEVAGVYLAALPDIKKSLEAKDRQAAVAALKAADTIAVAAKAAKANTTKEAPKVEPTVITPPAATDAPGVEVFAKALMAALGKSEAKPAPVAEPVKEPVTAPAPVADKSVQPDAMKAFSEAVTKAVEAAVSPLREKVDELAKRAAPGGPILTGTQMFRAGKDVIGELTADRVEVIKVLTEHSDPMVSAAAKQVLAELSK